MKIKRNAKGLLIFAMGLSMMITGCKKKEITPISKEETVYTEYRKLSNADKADKVKRSSYYSDVTYNGEDVPYYLFEVPFQKTENYIPNKDLSEKLSEDALNDYTSETKKYLAVLFDKSYRDVINDQEGFMDSYEEMFPSEDVFSKEENTEKDQSFSEKLMEWYVDNRATVEEEYVTGKPLLYGDMGLYVLRGSLELRIASADNEKAVAEFNDLFGSDILNEEGVGCAIIESVFFPSADSALLGVEIEALDADTGSLIETEGITEEVTEKNK